MPLVTDMKERIFEAARRANFGDPFTGLVPRSERALSGLLAFHGQRALIDWSQVPLLEIRDFPESRTRADSLVKKGGTYVSEYLLLHASTEEENIWGHMPADVIYLSAESDAVVLWENKIGSSVGYGPAAETNQFARQLRYLEAIRRVSTWVVMRPFFSSGQPHKLLISLGSNFSQRAPRQITTELDTLRSSRLARTFGTETLRRHPREQHCLLAVGSRST